jgi:gluconate 2-dehydrogenase gamma chain
MSSKSNWQVVPDHAGDDEYLFFSKDEIRTLDAATARIIPTDGDPGAREAHVVRFIDRYLSGTSYIYAAADGSGFLRLEGKENDAWAQRVSAMQQRYREGIVAIESLSHERFSAGFADLDDDQQDALLEALSGWPKPTTVDIRPMVEGRKEKPGAGGAPPSNQPIPDDQLDFFPMLVLHTRQGFYSDPVYGGNAGHIGWQVIGFPGPTSLAQPQEGGFSTVEYMLPDATWPYTDSDSP